MKTYVITLSKVFPATHPRAGQPTGFFDKFMAGQAYSRKGWLVSPKLHTIRANYDLWKKRFEQIAAGEACLSVRQWSGAPYRSKQVEIARLTNEDGIGIQKLRIKPFQQHLNSEVYLQPFIYDDTTHPVNMERLANNDGLSLEDWRQWFKDYDLSKPLAIIHFTKFRY